MTKFGTNADGAIWWPNLKPIQVVPLWTVLTERFTQDMKSIPWVRCASGNVYERNESKGNWLQICSGSPILLSSMCFKIRIPSPFHLATSIIPIQNHKYTGKTSKTDAPMRIFILSHLKCWKMRIFGEVVHHADQCATCIGSKFDHQMAPIALVANLPTRWRHKEPGLF